MEFWGQSLQLAGKVEWWCGNCKNYSCPPNWVSTDISVNMSNIMVCRCGGAFCTDLYPLSKEMFLSSHYWALCKWEALRNVPQKTADLRHTNTIPSECLRNIMVVYVCEWPNVGGWGKVKRLSSVLHFTAVCVSIQLDTMWTLHGSMLLMKCWSLVQDLITLWHLRDHTVDKATL